MENKIYIGIRPDGTVINATIPPSGDFDINGKIRYRMGIPFIHKARDYSKIVNIKKEEIDEKYSWYCAVGETKYYVLKQYEEFHKKYIDYRTTVIERLKSIHKAQAELELKNAILDETPMQAKPTIKKYSNLVGIQEGLEKLTRLCWKKTQGGEDVISIREFFISEYIRIRDSIYTECGYSVFGSINKSSGQCRDDFFANFPKSWEIIVSRRRTESGTY